MLDEQFAYHANETSGIFFNCVTIDDLFSQGAEGHVLDVEGFGVLPEDETGI